MSDYCEVCHNGAFVGRPPDKCEECGRTRASDSSAPSRSLPDRSELSIRISDALDILDDLERSKTVYGGFAKEQLRRIRATLKPEAENDQADGPRSGSVQ